MSLGLFWLHYNALHSAIVLILGQLTENHKNMKLIFQGLELSIKAFLHIKQVVYGLVILVNKQHIAFPCWASEITLSYTQKWKEIRYRSQ